MKQERGNAWPAAYGRCVLDSVDSTNAEAARRAPGMRGPEWILAREQTAARGRRGRSWASPAGHFAATLAMRPSESPDRVALRSFVAALALFDALVAATGQGNGIALKWPNDVLLNGGKLAGILLESAGSGGHLGHFAIGIGVNLREAPAAHDMEPGAVPPVSLLSETGIWIAPEVFLDLLAPAYARREAQFVTYGFAPIRTAWLARAAKLGETITARTTRETYRGRFETVDADGKLVLATATERMAIAAAEVFF